MQYELMLITSAKNGSDSAASNVEKIIKNSSVSVKVNKLGKKTLAYPILGETEAEYFVFNFEAEGAAILEINSKLRLEQESILRYLIIKPSGKENPKVEVSAPEEKRRPKVTVKTVVSKTSAKETKKAKSKAAEQAKTKKGKKK